MALAITARERQPLVTESSIPSVTRVKRAADAESGLELAKTQAPELIFLDIVLPGMDGFAALRQRLG